MSTALSQNANFLIDRYWDYVGARRRWICRRNSRELDHGVVELSSYDRLRNMAVLIERGFEASLGGCWRKGVFTVDSRMVEGDHERFTKYLSAVLRGQPEKTRG